MKSIKPAPTYFGSRRNHHQGAEVSVYLKLQVWFQRICWYVSLPVLWRHFPTLNLTFRGPCILSIFVLIYFQLDATLHSLFISGKLLYMFRMVSSPIIRNSYNCIYSIRYLLTITAICLYCGRVGAGLSVVWELYRSVKQYIEKHKYTQYIEQHK